MSTREEATDVSSSRRSVPREPDPDIAPGALQGVRVIDLSRVLAGPYCTQILADHGADVLKIESESGDETRGWGPPFDARGDASYFLALNRNKRADILDLGTPSGRDALLALLEHADVLVENFKSGTLEKWGLGWEVLHARFPRLVLCRITGFGADGPLGGLPGYDAAIQALAGIMSVNGEPDERGGAPLRVGMPVVDMFTGLNAALGILFALHERARSGRGQRVDVCLYDVGLSMLLPHAANHLLDGRLPTRSGNAHANIYPYDTFRTGTEPLFLAVGNDRQFAVLCQSIGADALPDDPRFLDNAARSTHRVALKALLEQHLAHVECQALAARLVRAGVSCAPIQDVATALASPHTVHRGLVIGIGDDYRGIASPIRLDRTPASYRLPPPNHRARPPSRAR